jgi:hypothetical protein
MIRVVRFADECPRFHRPAYWRYAGGAYGGEHVCAWPGLHWVLRLGRRLWEWSWRYRYSRFEQMLAEAHENGRNEIMRRFREVSGMDSVQAAIMIKQMGPEVVARILEHQGKSWVS